MNGLVGQCLSYPAEHPFPLRCMLCRLLVDGWSSLLRNSPNMNTLVGLGAVSSFAVSAAAALMPKLGWPTFFEEPLMLLAFVLLGRSLEERAKLQVTPPPSLNSPTPPPTPVSAAAALTPKLGWPTFFEEPLMLLAFVLLRRSLEERAKLQVTSLPPILATPPPSLLAPYLPPFFPPPPYSISPLSLLPLSSLHPAHLLSFISFALLLHQVTSDMTALLSLLPPQARLLESTPGKPDPAPNLSGTPQPSKDNGSTAGTGNGAGAGAASGGGWRGGGAAMGIPLSRIVPTESVCVGDQVVVLPGERVPVDGVVMRGKTTVDESSISGESLPILKQPGVCRTSFYLARGRPYPLPLFEPGRRPLSQGTPYPLPLIKPGVRLTPFH